VSNDISLEMAQLSARPLQGVLASPSPQRQLCRNSFYFMDGLSLSAVWPLGCPPGLDRPPPIWFVPLLELEVEESLAKETRTTYGAI